MKEKYWPDWEKFHLFGHELDFSHLPTGDEEVIRQGGCEAYISKPISVTSFLETVRRFVG